MMKAVSFLFIYLLRGGWSLTTGVEAWRPSSLSQQERQQRLHWHRYRTVPPVGRLPKAIATFTTTRLFETSESERSQDTDDQEVKRTSFDQAGRSLVDEEDQKRIEEMGDFDENPSVRHVSV